MKDLNVQTLIKNNDLKTIAVFLRTVQKPVQSLFYINMTEEQREQMDKYSFQLRPTAQELYEAEIKINHQMYIITQNLQ